MPNPGYVGNLAFTARNSSPCARIKKGCTTLSGSNKEQPLIAKSQIAITHIALMTGTRFLEAGCAQAYPVAGATRDREQTWWLCCC